MSLVSKVSLAVLLVALAACGDPAVTGPLSPSGVALADAPGLLDDEGACTGTWLRLPHPGELAYELDQWTVFLVAEGHGDPHDLTYSSSWTSTATLPGEPMVWVGAGPQTQAPVAMVRVGTWEKPITVTVTARAGRDCSRRTVSFPSEHPTEAGLPSR